MAGIIYSDYYLPATTYSALEVLERSNREEVQDDEFREFFISQSRLNNIYIEEKRTELEILESLFEKLFANVNIKGEDIDQIIFTSFPYHTTKDGICIINYIQEKFGAKNAAAINMYCECATTIQALQFANALIDSGASENIVIVSICNGFKMEERFIGTTIVGDGAGIILLGNNGTKSTIEGVVTRTDGRYSYLRERKSTERIQSMDTINKGSELILQLVGNKGLEMKDIKLLIPQNMSYHSYYVYSKLLNLPMDRMYLKNIPSGGHFADVDTIRNLTDAAKEGILNTGDRFLLYGVGNLSGGLDCIYTAALLTYKE